jgi:UDP-3-O-[3-hydroxymyristoyl] glucosamine N-acyltransferase
MLEIKYTLAEVAAVVSSLTITGGTDRQISGIKSLADASNSDLSFLGNVKYRGQLEKTEAAIVLVGADVGARPKENQAFVVCKNPSFALGLLCRDIERKYLSRRPSIAVHGSAVISPSAKLGHDVHIGPCAVVEDGAEIGDGAKIGANCYVGWRAVIGAGSELHAGSKVMSLCSLGKNVILYPGAIVGSDGFGYESVDGVHEKLPQIGDVSVGDGVEIGANTTVDRARFGSTVIGAGTKIDNLVQIGHNVTVGKHCLIVAQVGIAGSTTIGDRVTIGGQTGIAGHVHIGDGTMIGGQTGVTSSCKPGSFLRCSPAMPYGEATKFLACRKRLPELVRQVRDIESRLAK